MTIIDALKKLYMPLPNGGRFTLPQDFPAFNGHFPDAPVLPAVVQIMMAVHVISEGVGSSRKLKEIKKAKFAAVIKSGDVIDVMVTPKENIFDIIIKNDSTVFSSFQIVTD